MIEETEPKEPVNIEFDKHPLELVAELIWNGDDEGSYYEAVKDMARTLYSMPFREAVTSHDVVKYMGAQEFFTRFLHEHVLDNFDVEDATMSNAWGLQTALLELARKERVK